MVSPEVPAETAACRKNLPGRPLSDEPYSPRSLLCWHKHDGRAALAGGSRDVSDEDLSVWTRSRKTRSIRRAYIAGAPRFAPRDACSARSLRSPPDARARRVQTTRANLGGTWRASSDRREHDQSLSHRRPGLATGDGRQPSRFRQGSKLKGHARGSATIPGQGKHAVELIHGSRDIGQAS